MATFVCVSRDPQGVERREYQDAADAESLTSRLRREGRTVLTLAPAGSLADRVRRVWRNRRVGTTDIVFAERQLAMMLKNGIDLSTALQSLARQTTHDRLRAVFEKTLSDVVGGEPLSTALARHPSLFPPVAVGLVRAGEETGKLGECLEEIARLGMRDLEIRSRVQGAFLYPVIVLSIASLVVLGFLLFVLPRFIEVFKSSGAELPLPTQILILLSLALRNGWPLIVAGIAAAGYGFWALRRTEAGRVRLDRLGFRLPLFGRLVLLSALSRFSRTLGTLLKSGVPMDRALAIAATVCDNFALEKTLLQVRDAVVRGTTLAEALRASEMMPDMLVQMVTSGEISGSLDEMLREVGEFYDLEPTHAIRNLVTALEPIMLITMGVVVAGMALAVLLPLFRMSQVYR